MITDEQLALWRELEAKATPGPWEGELDQFDPDEGIVATVADPRVHMLASINTDVRGHFVDDASKWTEQDAVTSREQWEKAKQSQALRDAAFIAASRSAVPALLAEVERLREIVADVSKVNPWGDACTGQHSSVCIFCRVLVPFESEEEDVPHMDWCAWRRAKEAV